MPAAAGVSPGPGRSSDPDVVLAELRKMRGLIRSQLFSLARWGSQTEGVAHGLMRRLRACGLSATLVRRLLAKIPAGADPAQAEAWAKQMLARVIRLDRAGQTILDVGGFHALVGPTGVGKTTTVAKMAAQFALRHGVDSIGLVTLDTYRIGAHDQLRTFGRLLGVPVRLAHDAAGLASFMSQNMSRKLVLVDTVGIGQRDERLNDLIDSMSSANIRKLLVLNAAAQPETLEDVVNAYRAGPHDGVVVSKVDEAVKLGGVVDCLVRHRLPLVGVADGQRVPEDWQFPDPKALVARAFDVPASPVFDFDGFDLASPASVPPPGSSTHA
jgi:flagellar biosynthesis protein FlhF